MYPSTTSGEEPAENYLLMPAYDERARSIKPNGTVTRYLRDGSVKIMFWNGAVCVKSSDETWSSTTKEGQFVSTDSQGNVIESKLLLKNVMTDVATKKEAEIREDMTSVVTSPGEHKSKVVEFEDGTRITTNFYASSNSNQEPVSYTIECLGYASITFDVNTGSSITKLSTGTKISHDPECSEISVTQVDGTNLMLDPEGRAFFQNRKGAAAQSVAPPKYLLDYANGIIECTDTAGKHFQARGENEIAVTEPPRHPRAPPPEQLQNWKINKPSLFVLNSDGTGSRLHTKDSITEYIEDLKLKSVVEMSSEQVPGNATATRRTYMVKLSENNAYHLAYAEASALPPGLSRKQLPYIIDRCVTKEAAILVRQITEFPPLSAEERQMVIEDVAKYGAFQSDREAKISNRQIIDNRSSEERARANALNSGHAMSSPYDDSSQSVFLQLDTDVIARYEEATRPPTPPPSAIISSRRKKIDEYFDTTDLEGSIKKVENDIKNNNLPNYFDSPEGQSFLEQIANVDALSSLVPEKYANTGSISLTGDVKDIYDASDDDFNATGNHQGESSPIKKIAKGENRDSEQSPYQVDIGDASANGIKNDEPKYLPQSVAFNDLSNLFDEYDLNKDGFLSYGELYVVLKEAYGDEITDEMLQRIVDEQLGEIDKDGDGKVSFTEFCSVIIKGQKDEERLLAAFNMYDLDGDGELSYAELFTVSKILLGESASDKELKDLVANVLDQADNDENGTVSFSEFHRFVKAFQKTESQRRAIFDLYDCDADGKISYDELYKVLEVVLDHDLSREVVDEIVADILGSADLDGDMQLDFDEFSSAIDGVENYDATTSMTPNGFQHFLRDEFDQLDIDGDGVITFKEVFTVIMSLMDTPDVDDTIAIASQFFEDFDKDGDNAVTFGEFRVVMEAARKRRLKKQFDAFDVDSNGFITPEELYSSVSQAFPDSTVADIVDYIASVIRRFDRNGDQEISFSEFCAAINAAEYPLPVQELPGIKSNDLLGQPRKSEIPMPTSIRTGRPDAIRPNSKEIVIESGTRRTLNTSSTNNALTSANEPAQRGFRVFPLEVDFGTLKEGCTYSSKISLKNVGVDSCRYKVVQPPPSTGMSVVYPLGPVAAGMSVTVEVRIYAMAIGDLGQGFGAVSHRLEFITETEVFFIPVRATVYTAGLFEARGLLVKKSNAVRLLSTKPPSKLDLSTEVIAEITLKIHHLFAYFSDQPPPPTATQLEMAAVPRSRLKVPFSVNYLKQLKVSASSCRYM
eukprot:UC4_evm1s1221